MQGAAACGKELLHGASVTASSLAFWEPPIDGVVAHVGKGDGTAESFREAEP